MTEYACDTCSGSWGSATEAEWCCKPSLLTDEEVCTILRIGRSTLTRLLKDGPPAEGGDVRGIEHTKVGGVRRWVRSSVLAFAGLKNTPSKEED